MARKFSEWTMLRRLLKPCAVSIADRFDWKISHPFTVESWLLELKYREMLRADDACMELIVGLSDNPKKIDGRLDNMLRRYPPSVIVHLMHRILFAVDLSQRMSVCWRREAKLIGKTERDALYVLRTSWRTNASFAWAHQFGILYEAPDRPNFPIGCFALRRAQDQKLN